MSSLKVETEQKLKAFRQVTGLEPLCEMYQKNAREKNAKLLFYIVKYANLGRSSRRRHRGSLSFKFSVEI